MMFGVWFFAKKSRPSREPSKVEILVFSTWQAEQLKAEASNGGCRDDCEDYDCVPHVF